MVPLSVLTPKKEDYMNTNKNKVTSVFTHGSANRLYFEFFDNTGKKKQKSTGLTDTQANRKKAWKMIPAFEKRLEEEAAKAADELKKKQDHPLSHYVQKHITSLFASKHTKAKTNARGADC